jgi:hypothetical protein
VFSNKGYGWKLLAGLAVIAGLGVLSGKWGDSINPALWRCVVEPRRWNGETLWIPEARILAAGAGDYEISKGDVRIRVTGAAPGPVGARITLVAVFHADGPTLEARRARLLPEGSASRRLMEIVSGLVLLGVLANLLRHFAFRPDALQVAERSVP